MTIRFHKVVGALPGSQDANAIYVVRTGVGFDPHVRDVTGQIAHSVNSGLLAWATPVQRAADPIPAGWYELAQLDAGRVAMRLLTQTAPVAVGWRAGLLGSAALGGSGHNLMDAWLDVGGYFRIIRNSLVTPSDVGYGVKFFKDTVPGSPLLYRRSHDSRIGDYPNTHWLGSEEDMALLDCFITTEGGGSFRAMTPRQTRLFFRETLENGLWFFDRAITFGRGGLGAECVWQTINTWYDGVAAWDNLTFRNVMIEHEKSSHYWVGYWEWKLRQMH